ncbi:hypothetical protein [Pseudomonas alkylphenolica]|uniref:DUF3077 domain-containing protein n=1 Tax=Pseudomonas alkylphenolica TaxID=237609 RepID=A0A077F7A7_9PSED|nr:hypothetical protein [Pseudomonas alkylphenolica]AIL61422.1 hypothetical protein PSAKL28_22020 [Pseudomonas alkylphenolica]
MNPHPNTVNLPQSLPIQRPGVAARKARGATAPHHHNCRRFFCVRFLCNGGCAWETFGAAGFPFASVREPAHSCHPIQDALVHASVLLKSAYQTNAHACEMVNTEVRGLLWATEQSIEMSLALVEALLDEVEARSATTALLRRSMQAGQSAEE